MQVLGIKPLRGPSLPLTEAAASAGVVPEARLGALNAQPRADA